MTSTLLDFTPLEVLDFDISSPCEHNQHWLITGQPPLPAAWLIVFKPSFPCGCTPRPSVAFCDLCWTTIMVNAPLNNLACDGCNRQIKRLSDYILRVETLKV